MDVVQKVFIHAVNVSIFAHVFYVWPVCKICETYPGCLFFFLTKNDTVTLATNTFCFKTETFLHFHFHGSKLPYMYTFVSKKKKKIKKD